MFDEKGTASNDGRCFASVKTTVTLFSASSDNKPDESVICGLSIIKTPKSSIGTLPIFSPFFYDKLAVLRVNITAVRRDFNRAFNHLLEQDAQAGQPEVCE